MKSFNSWDSGCRKVKREQVLKFSLKWNQIPLGVVGYSVTGSLSPSLLSFSRELPKNAHTPPRSHSFHLLCINKHPFIQFLDVHSVFGMNKCLFGPDGRF
jgi:hypothetical protein